MIHNKLRELNFLRHSFNDYSTKRRLVVIESDDWGSIRMPSHEVFTTLCKLGFAIDQRPFEKFDSIASNKDFEHLVNTLSKHRDANGNHPVITANVITANPDFQKIEENSFKKYDYEPFTNTLAHYDDISFNTWTEAIKHKVFFPQLHGREHLNVPTWMESLNKVDSDDKLAFDYQLMGIPTKAKPESGNQHQIAFNIDFNKVENKEFIKDSIREAQSLFHEAFGFHSKTFIAPVYTWTNEVEAYLKDQGIVALQGGRFQSLPLQAKKIKHYTGQISKHSQLLYMVRNAFFEPSTVLEYHKRDNNLNKLKAQTDLVFKYRKPLIISMHRLNFIGRIFEKNRIVNMKILDNYLHWLLNKYPNVEFITSQNLAQIIKYESSHS